MVKGLRLGSQFGIRSWKLVIFWLLLLGCWSLVYGMGSAPSAKAPVAKAGEYLIETFEDGDFNLAPEWWVFDQITPTVVDNNAYRQGEPQVLAELGRYSLLINGTSKGDWYAGGMGTYIAKEKQDLSIYNAFQMDIFGYGPGTGSIKIELIDDDSKNWEVEQDPARSYIPTKDDRFVTEVRPEWKGWRRVTIPFADFVDDNPGMGDDKWNPQQLGGSGGLLQFQLICIAGSRKGTLKYNIDNIKLIK